MTVATTIPKCWGEGTTMMMMMNLVIDIFGRMSAAISNFSQSKPKKNET
jgi:hypothetical protein